MFIASRNRFTIDKLKKDLSFEFEIKDLGEAKIVLGIKIEKDQKSGKICLTQKEYLKKIIEKFNINGDIKSVSTLLASHFKLKLLCLLLPLKSVSICLTYYMLAQFIV